MLRMTRRRFLGTASSVALVAACTPTAPSTGTAAPTAAASKGPNLAANQKITYALDFEMSGVDPHINQAFNAHKIIMNVFDPLVFQTADGKVYPGLASSWDISPDGKTYTFKLRNDVKFHDGTPFNAAAMAFSFDRIRDPNTKSQYAITLLGPIDSYQAVDDSTFRVNFKTPYPAFLDALSYAWLAPVSPTAVRRLGADFSRNLVGTGPFKFKEWVAKDRITLERNPDYQWGPSFFKHKGPAYLEQIKFVFIPEWATRSAVLETGEIDYSGDALAADIARLKSNSKLRVIVTPLGGVPQSYFLNVTKAPFDDVRVRRAFLQGVDKQTVINTMHAGAFQPAFGPLTRATTGYDKSAESNSALQFNKDQAKKQLDDAGWKVGAGGIRTKDGQNLQLQLQWLSMTINRDPQQAELLQGIVKDLGIDVKIATVPSFPNLSAAIGQNNYHLVPSFWQGSDPNVLYQAYHSKNVGANNWSKSKIPELDRLLDQADAEPNVQKRLDLYAQVQKMVMDQALSVPVWDSANVLAMRANLTDITPDRRGIYVWLFDAYVQA